MVSNIQCAMILSITVSKKNQKTKKNNNTHNLKISMSKKYNSQPLKKKKKKKKKNQDRLTCHLNQDYLHAIPISIKIHDNVLFIK